MSRPRPERRSHSSDARHIRLTASLSLLILSRVSASRTRKTPAFWVTFDNGEGQPRKNQCKIFTSRLGAARARLHALPLREILE